MPQSDQKDCKLTLYLVLVLYLYLVLVFYLYLYLVLVLFLYLYLVLVLYLYLYLVLVCICTFVSLYIQCGFPLRHCRSLVRRTVNVFEPGLIHTDRTLKMEMKKDQKNCLVSMFLFFCLIDPVTDN